MTEARFSPPCSPFSVCSAAQCPWRAASTQWRGRKVLGGALRLGVIVAAVCTNLAHANPTGAQVVNGTATFHTSGSTLTVTNSNNAIINWQSFSINAAETTRFVQPSATSSVLNRVQGGDPSHLLGQLQSNGKVFLINPAGILVGQGARIDVGALVASTLGLSDEDFLAGRLNFNATGNAGPVVNQGVISTGVGGTVVLSGPVVSNEGSISTPQGQTVLAAGQTVRLTELGAPGLSIEVTGTDTTAANVGQIAADAGTVGIVGALVKNRGVVSASGVRREGGRIFLRASRDAYVEGDGRLQATGLKGGQIEVTGQRVAVMDQASLDASGEQGGGRVMVGGDWQGKNPDVANAQQTYFGPDASIKVDATQSGDGGTAVVWADGSTRAHGTISAKGGATGGAGGLIETSGKKTLEVSGIRVDSRAADGSAGMWLLDPNDISIVPDGAGTSSTLTGYTNESEAVWEFGNGTNEGNPSILTDKDINAGFSNANVLIITNGFGGFGDIDVKSGVSITNQSGSSRILTLTADRNIVIDQNAAFKTTANEKLEVIVKAPNGSISYYLDSFVGMTPTLDSPNLKNNSAMNVKSTTDPIIASTTSSIDLSVTNVSASESLVPTLDSTSTSTSESSTSEGGGGTTVTSVFIEPTTSTTSTTTPTSTLPGGTVGGGVDEFGGPTSSTTDSSTSGSTTASTSESTTSASSSTAESQDDKQQKEASNGRTRKPSPKMCT